MPKDFRTRRTALFLSLAALALCPPEPAHAFDTAPHHDMTRAAFQDEGFAPGSPVIQIAQVSNWLVDFQSVLQEKLGAAPQLAHLHFDNLTSTAQIRNVWARLALNTQGAVQAAVADVRSAPNDVERYRRMVHLAVLIGASLHPVQDFYSHSNWVELYPMGSGVYGTRTWFDTPAPSGSLHTGLVGKGTLDPSGNPAQDHGGYARGMNHDSHTRPRWSQAYVYGYSASRQWLRAVQEWVEKAQPGLWRELQLLQLRPEDVTDLQQDLRASYLVSLWVHAGGKNGAWNGPGSGDVDGFLSVTVGWLMPPYSIFVKRFSGAAAYAPLVRDMEKRDVDPGAPPAMPRVALGRRAVEVRTVRAAMQDGGGDFWGQADLFAIVTIAGQRYVEATQQGQDDATPTWLSVGMVPDSGDAVTIVYELMDEDYGLTAHDDVIDIHPAAGRTRAKLVFDVHGHALSGDLRGVYDSERRLAVLRGGGGDNDPASVTLYVTEYALEDPHTAATSPR